MPPIDCDKIQDSVLLRTKYRTVYYIGITFPCHHIYMSYKLSKMVRYISPNLRNSVIINLMIVCQLLIVTV